MATNITIATIAAALATPRRLATALKLAALVRGASRCAERVTFFLVKANSKRAQIFLERRAIIGGSND
jgi:hypothetical protein